MTIMSEDWGLTFFQTTFWHAVFLNVKWRVFWIRDKRVLYSTWSHTALPPHALYAAHLTCM